MFTVLVCADLYGSKVNLEIPFPNAPPVPSINELTRTIEQIFEQEAHYLKPPGYPLTEVKVSRIQIYDDTYLNWMDLVNSSQLHEYDQLYIFQPQSRWHVDLQKDLPAPRPPSMPMGVPVQTVSHTGYGQQSNPTPYSAAAAAPPQPPSIGSYLAQPPPQQQQSSAAVVPFGGYSASPSLNAVNTPYYQQPQYAQVASRGPSFPASSLPQPTGAAAMARERPNIPKEQKAQQVFRDLDLQQRGWIDLTDMERGFRARGIDFSTNTVQELFMKGDANQDSRIDWNEWVSWCELYANTLEVMYYRGREALDEDQLAREKQQTQEALERNRQRESELRRQLEEVGHEFQTLQQQLAEMDARGREAVTRRNLMEQQERDLLEQEIKLERQKDQLRASQHRFQEVAQTFDTSAVGHGSPRRALQSQIHEFR